jgi:hypothetical protein
MVSGGDQLRCRFRPGVSDRETRRSGRTSAPEYRERDSLIIVYSFLPVNDKIYFTAFFLQENP